MHVYFTNLLHLYIVTIFADLQKHLLGDCLVACTFSTTTTPKHLSMPMSLPQGMGMEGVLVHLSLVQVTSFCPISSLFLVYLTTCLMVSFLMEDSACWHAHWSSALVCRHVGFLLQTWTSASLISRKSDFVADLQSTLLESELHSSWYIVLHNL